MSRKRRVLVVDDSAPIRHVLSHILNRHPDLEVVGQAGDPYQAREQIIAHSPDVLTLDVEMPRMDGLTFLGKLMKAHPMPVVMVSSLTQRGTETALEALALGAVEVVGKPVQDTVHGLEQQAEAIAEVVFAASFARIGRRREPTEAGPPIAPVATEARISVDAVLPRPKSSGRTAGPIVAIGSSTGGTEALKAVLEALPGGLPPILVVQHMLPGFTAAYAERLDRLCEVEVKLAEPGESPRRGTVYFAPSEVHLAVEGRASGLALGLLEGPRVSRHLPSVDVLFRSVAIASGPKALGIILTGMGDDGAQGLLEMRQAGATTLGQDEATSVVYGMPRVAWLKGAVQKQIPLHDVAQHIAQWAERA